MRIQHIALVSEHSGPSSTELALVAAALQQQVMRHLAPLWGVAATVQPFPELEYVPLGYWPVIITGKPLGAEAGIQRDDNNQPYAQIQFGALWSLEASSVCLEMLVNPSEDRVAVGPSPKNHGALGEFLVEVCGPCDPRRGYVIRDVVVSDFCTPAFFGLQLAPQAGYSVNGSVTAPFQLGKWGHLTWREPASGSWWLRSHWGEGAVDTQLGPLDRRAISLRGFVQACRSGLTAPPGSSWETRAPQYRQASRARAERLRALPPAPLEPSLRPALSRIRKRQTLRYGEDDGSQPMAAGDHEARVESVERNLSDIMFDLSVAAPQASEAEHAAVVEAAVEPRRERTSSVPPVARTLPPRLDTGVLPWTHVRRWKRLKELAPKASPALLAAALVLVIAGAFGAGRYVSAPAPLRAPERAQAPAPTPPLASTVQAATSAPPQPPSPSLEASVKTSQAPRGRVRRNPAPSPAAAPVPSVDIEALIESRR